MTAFVVPLQLGPIFGRLRPEPARRRPARTIRGRAEPEAARGIDVNDASDETLLTAYLDGDRSALRELIRRYRVELLHFLTRFLGDRAAAEDVFQETFLQVHLSADTFDASRRFKPWLFAIAANKARDHHRKHRRRAPMSLSAAIDASGEGEAFVDLMSAELPSPDQPILDAERSRMVREVVDSMRVHLREILLLAYFQKMSYQQMAEALGIPLGTVKSRLHTAVAAFAHAWETVRRHQQSAPRSGGEETPGGSSTPPSS
jgi:RNA polymerase sigma-70 factor (ECF subfamily)